MASVLTVRQLNLYVKTLLEGDSKLSFVSVSGELSNFKHHYSSGHLYFSLKDNDALIKCVMFRAGASTIAQNLKDGDKVICSGRISLYEKEGQYQFYVEKIIPVGIGDVAEQFRITKEKLEKEGLFLLENKRQLPEFPKNIAVITSETGAAVQDIINIIERRYPLVDIILCPVLVQGIGAADSMKNALKLVYNTNADLIIIGRGGGSAEDLSAFNEEGLARILFESPIPTISAVGHETDFTICDFVADLRAPTPSAAAEIAVPDIVDIKSQIFSLSKRLSNASNYNFTKYQLKLEKLCSSYVFQQPEQIFSNKEILFENTLKRLNISIEKIISSNVEGFTKLATKLDTISPLKVLSRGYAAVSKDGQMVNSIGKINEKDNITLNFSDGKANCTVNKIYEV